MHFLKSKFVHVVVCLLALYAVPAMAQPSDLFISEYIEGSSNNKAIEIYNGTGATVNLAAGGYNIQMFFNGSTTAGLTINLTGTIPAGDVYVLAQSSANSAILIQADQTSSASWYNGDDAVVLRKGSTIIDAFGQVGFDPGTEWGAGLQSTADNTLRRKPAVCSGDVNGLDAFAPAVEWDGFAIDTFGGLGVHTSNCTSNEPVVVTCGAAIQIFQGNSATRNVSARDADGIVTAMSITSPAIDGISLTDFAAASTVGGTATATVNVAQATAAGNYNVVITAANNDTPTAQTGTCTLVVNVIGPREIFAIQGSGAASPFVGQVVKTDDNIVTAIGYTFDAATQTNNANGFFIQTPVARADASDQTSNGIFVFTGSAPTVNVGDQVDVVGTVAEFFGFTELTSPTVTVDSSGNALPPSFLFTQVGPGAFVPSHDQPWPANELERFEGMLVRVENGTVTSPTDRFGDTPIVADNTRAVRGPGMEYPGQDGYATIWDGNPEIFDLKADGAGLASTPLAAGTVIHVAEGPLAFAFSDYQIWPTRFEFTQPQLPRPVRARKAGEFTVASQNMLRFFDSNRDNGPDDGAANAAQYENKLVKASLHVRTVLGAPDVLVVEEVENIGVVQALAAQIAADDSSLVYTAYLFEGHDVGGIDTGVLVRDTVNVSNVTQIGADTIFEPGAPQPYLHDRPPVVLDGEYVANGTPFPITVIGIHNRSLGGIEGTAASALRVREKRLRQAKEIAEYMQNVQTTQPERRVVLIGDFNAFQYSDGFVDAIGIITGNLDPNGAIHPGHVDVVDPNLINQGASLPAAEKYSYIFEGSSQTLDHTLTTQNLQPYVRGLQLSRGNADAPVALAQDWSTPLGLSDHDGEVLFVMSDADADGLPDDADNCAANPNPTQNDFDGDNIGDACDADDDNDGVLDVSDACQLSEPLGLFVIAGSCTTGVPDQILSNGCSISASIASFAEAATNHGKFVSSVAHFLNGLRKDDAIDNKQRSEIQRCAAWANVP